MPVRQGGSALAGYQTPNVINHHAPLGFVPHRQPTRYSLTALLTTYSGNRPVKQDVGVYKRRARGSAAILRSSVSVSRPARW